jgi:hypothetical protein
MTLAHLSSHCLKALPACLLLIVVGCTQAPTEPTEPTNTVTAPAPPPPPANSTQVPPNAPADNKAVDVPVEGTPAATPSALEEVPTPGQAKRIEFNAGASSGVVKGSIIRGERSVYLLGAKRGQTMSIDVASTESNAVFDLVGTDGKTVTQEATSWNGVLATDGDYQIVVGGTRGNVEYTMKVEIK